MRDQDLLWTTIEQGNKSKVTLTHMPTGTVIQSEYKPDSCRFKTKNILKQKMEEKLKTTDVTVTLTKEEVEYLMFCMEGEMIDIKKSIIKKLST